MARGKKEAAKLEVQQLKQDTPKTDETSEINIVATPYDSYAYRMNGSPEADENVIAEKLLRPLLEKLYDLNFASAVPARSKRDRRS